MFNEVIMRKYILFFILSIICLAWASDGYCVATKMYGRTALTGGTKSVDNITTMVDGDLCFAVVSSTLYIYVYDDDDATAEGANIDGVDPIEPDSVGTGAWELFTSLTLGASSNPTQIFRDLETDNDISAATVDVQCSDAATGTEDCDYVVQVMIGGALTPVMTIDADGSITFGLGIDIGDLNITNVGDIAADSISADGTVLEIGDADEETYVQADGIPDANDTYSCGLVLWLTAGNAVKQFDLVMMMADGKVDMANATGVPIGFAVEESNDGWPAADTELIGVCMIGSGGTIRNDEWTGHTAGEIVYTQDADGTAGFFDPADEIDLEDGDYWTAVGVMQEEDVIIFPVPAFGTDDGT